MEEKDLATMTDEELLQEAKKMKSSSVTHAVLIGFLIGIIIYSVAKNSWGFLTLIPVYLIYRLMTKSKRNEALKQLLKERNLKP